VSVRNNLKGFVLTVSSNIERNNDQEPILVIVGPTASGKTGLAVRVAQELSRRRGCNIEAGEVAAEIISADSRAIYIDMDIGTAKPDMEERGGIPHYGFDLVEPGERFTAYEFQQYARECIDKIRAQGKLPIIAGGTGLYVDALIYDYDFSADSKKNYTNRQEMNSDYVVIGIDWPREVLRQRIEERANKFFAQPIEEETIRCVEKYGWDSGAMTSNIYPIVWDMLRGKISQEEAIRLFALDDWHLAKRQLTWFKRNKNIHWLKLDEAEQWILDFYSKDK
jgi:tRNA dimethylallyltransferase